MLSSQEPRWAEDGEEVGDDKQEKVYDDDVPGLVDVEWDQGMEEEGEGMNVGEAGERGSDMDLDNVKVVVGYINDPTIGRVSWVTRGPEGKYYGEYEMKEVGQDDDNDNEDYYWDDDDMGSTGWGLCPSTPGTTSSAGGGGRFSCFLDICINRRSGRGGWAYWSWQFYRRRGWIRICFEKRNSGEES